MVKVCSFNAEQTALWPTHGVVVADRCLRTKKKVANARDIDLNDIQNRKMRKFLHFSAKYQNIIFVIKTKCTVPGTQ